VTYDAIVVGSGFGGAVVACRLAEKGCKVLVFERGRHWNIDKNFHPDDWFFDHNDPVEHNGWFDFRVFGRMSTVAGAGVGGGSLHYANTSIDAPKDAFDAGWPHAINHRELAPYYNRVKDMLSSAPIPARQEPEKLKLLRNAAMALGYEQRFAKVDLAITFNEQLDYDSRQPPPSPDAVVFKKNVHGVDQGSCIHLGECVLGCRVRARNMLDYNYLAEARNNKAEIRPLHLVRSIRPATAGYAVEYEEITETGLKAGSEHAKLVVVSAGSIGTTELLLRCRDEHKSLPGLGPMVGKHWCSNTNYLTLADHANFDVYPTRGPSITGAVEFFGDQAHLGAGVNIEDGGIPPTIVPFSGGRGFGGSGLLAELHKTLGADGLFRHKMPWFSQGRDESTGEFSLRKQWVLFGKRVLHLSWDPAAADKPMKAIIDLHERMAKATGGDPPPSLWPLLRALVTPHPLGGCVMADDPAQGVVNHRGEVFAYPGLYIADGSIIPRAIGLNPSKTIAALAERIAEGIKC